MASAIVKESKNGCHFVNMCHTEKFHITNPSKVLVSGFMTANRNRILASAIIKKIEKWLPFHRHAGLPHGLFMYNFTLPDIFFIQSLQYFLEVFI